MKKKSYKEMVRKELLQIAKLYGVKGRHKMTKEKLIMAISKKKEPIEKLRKFEENLKQKKLPHKYDKNHIELLPKEPGIVYVHWEIQNQKKQPVLKLMEKKKSVLSIPVMSKIGDGYMHVDGGKNLRAIIGIKSGKQFKKIVESEEITVPVSTPSNNKTVRWVKIDLKRGKVMKTHKNTKVTKELKEKKKKTEKIAKTVKYIHIPKEGTE